MLKFVQELYFKAGLAVTGLLITMVPAEVLAQGAPAPTTGQGILGLTNKVGGQIGRIPWLLSAIAYILGAFFFVIGLFKLKQHIENPSQAKLGPALGYMVVGVLFLAFPWSINLISDTLGAGTSNVTAPGALPDWN